MEQAFTATFKNRPFLDLHRLLLEDTVRTESFSQAIQEVVREGDVVVDIGCGTGILAFIACQAKARKVYAIEAGDIIEFAKVLAQANGLEDRVHFIRGHSRRTDLPERVDVVISEMIGNFALDEGILGTFMDARQRFLKPEGKIIPKSVELVIAPVELPQFSEKTEIWSADCYGFDFSPARSYFLNRVHYLNIEPSAFLGRPASLGCIELAEVKTTNFASEESLKITRNGVLHGIGGWFRSQLTPSVFLTSEPPSRTPNWLHILFPLEEPVGVKEGDEITVVINSTLNGSQWGWQVECPDHRGGSRRLEQSTFWSFPVTSERLRQQSWGRAPGLTRRGEAGLLVLQSLQADKTIGAIFDEVLAHYPETFKSLQDAGDFVMNVIETFCKD